MKKLLMVMGLLGFTGLVPAEEPQGIPAPAQSRAIDRFPQLDADSDGRLSREEVADDAALAPQFDALDRDRNGFINRDEFPRSNVAPTRDFELDDERVLPSREPAFPGLKPLVWC